MERVQSINGERLAWCCADHGITAGELASATGIAQASIERVMAGDGGITFNQLRKIAEYFGRGVLFFLETAPVDVEHAHTPQFRTLANQKPELSAKIKALIERVEQQRAVYLSLREDLDGAGRPWFDPPAVTRQNLQEAARAVREWLGLAAENTFDTYRAAVEARGILVFRSNGYNGKWQIAKESPILGFALYDATCPVIVVKKRRWETQQSFTLMHELGHLLLHKTSSIDDEQDMHSREGWEREANAFAGYLLVPDEFLAVISDDGKPAAASQYDDWLVTQRRAWGVSTEAILLRLLDSGRLLRREYNEYRQWRDDTQETADEDGGSRAYRHREPKHVFGDTFVRTVLDALSARHITLVRASRYLDSLKISDLHQLERHYAGL